MRLWDGTEIMKPTVDRGLTQWDTMAGDLDEKLSDRVAKVKAALAAAPWGTGAEGVAFWNAHFQGNGPNLLLDQCAQLCQEISGEPGRVRAAVGNTLQVSTAMEEDLSAMMRQV
ncbi:MULTISPECIES: hypothetical protein [Nonomuraea]|uniref:WXG100 family type VII secretion target n=1 Tax=Nonomuraea harbinensis TaxID=1286938 RepID=A0ABW1BRQ5_9ACTN|nr:MULTISPECIES: hypothetical protein [Nonomuraea]TXK38786.1 hypothetical protein FR742_03680 [Nonomuraea sp. C10]